MSIQRTIVSYSQIQKAFHGNFEAIQAAAGGGLESALPPEPGEQARMIAQLSSAMDQLELAERRPGVMVTAQDQVASLLQTFLAQQSAQAAKVNPVGSNALEATFDNNDILGWAGSFFTWWKKIFPHKLISAAPNPDPLPNTARVALFADWGTGLYGAPVSAKSIENEKNYQVVMHLGDTYYSGDDSEIRQRLMQDWPKLDGATSRALNGNHEMYTGGKAYFDIALPQLGQKASYFAIQNDFWTLVGLDTAYKDHDLAGDQLAWLTNILNNAGDRKTVLFTHHQPYSLLDKQGPNLIQKLGAFLDTRKIFAWYWGHEHRCVLYDRHPAWGLYGRCIGHGGFPYFRDDLGEVPSSPQWKRVNGKNLVPGGTILDGLNPYVEGHEKEYGPQGYLSLAFQDQRLTEIVRDADGTVLNTLELTATAQAAPAGD